MDWKISKLSVSTLVALGTALGLQGAASANVDVADSTLTITLSGGCALSQVLNDNDKSVINNNSVTTVKVQGNYACTNDLDFATYTGTWYLSMSEFRVTVANALGSGKVTMSSNGVLGFDVQDGVWNNDFDFVSQYNPAKDYNFQFTAGSTVNGTVTSLKNLSINRGKTGSGALTFNGPVLVPDAVLRSHPSTVGQGRDIHYVGRVQAKEMQGNTWNQSHGGVLLYNSENIIGKINSDYHNVHLKGLNCATGAVLQAGYNENNERSWYYISADQEIDRFTDNGSYKSSGAVVGHTVAMSNKARVTMRGTADDSTDMKFAGTGTLVWWPVDDFTFTFSNSRVHTLAGELVVSNGTLAVTDAASFDGITALEAADNATFDWQSSSTLAAVSKITLGANATLNFATGLPISGGKVDFALKTGAKIHFSDGMTLNAKSLKLNGEDVDPGNYTGVDGVTDATKVDWIDGAGIINVPAQQKETVLATWDAGGGTDANFTTAANWEGDETPRLTDGSLLITVAAGATAVADTNIFLDGLVFADSVAAFALLPDANPSRKLTLSFDGITVPDRTDLSAGSYTNAIPTEIASLQQWNIGANSTFTQLGRLTSNPLSSFEIGRGGAGKLIVYGDGTDTFTGSVLLTNGVTELHGESPFGISDVNGRSKISATINKNSIFRMCGATLTKPLTINNTDDGTRSTFTTAGWTRNVFKEKVTFTGTTIRPGFVDGSEVVFEGGLECPLYWAIAGNNYAKIVITNTPAEFTGTWQWEAQPELWLCVSSNKFSSFNASYVSNSKIHLRAPWALYEGTTEFNMKNDGHEISLGGYPQKLGKIGSFGGAAGTTCRIVNEEERPATLYVNQGAAATWYGDIAGAVDFIKQGAGKVTWQSRAVSAVGELTIEDGCIEFASDSSYLGATNVTLAANGQLIIASGSTFAQKTDLHLAGTAAQLTLNNETSQKIGLLFVNGQRLPPGLYGGSDCTDSKARKLDCLAGTGTLRSMGDGLGLAIVIK